VGVAFVCFWWILSTPLFHLLCHVCVCYSRCVMRKPVVGYCFWCIVYVPGISVSDLCWSALCICVIYRRCTVPKT
jgi:hypothetical protein